ncbi:MAG: hypothetical protein RJA47_799 [Actinomycetota bacterium]|jgi:uncharacterized protein YukE
MPEQPTAGGQAPPGDPEYLRIASRVLSMHSDTMLNIGQMLDQSAREMGWHCDKATRYRENVALIRNDARKIATLLQGLAAMIALHRIANEARADNIFHA